jgi:uncharacterized protein (TIGR00255 family)
MTGFGRAVVDGPRNVPGGAGRWIVEMRSVNHRGFDLKVRGPDIDPALEADIARAIRAVVERGTVTVAIREEQTFPAGLDVSRVRETLAALEAIRVEARIAAPVDLATVAAFLASDPAARADVAPDAVAATLRSGVTRALDELVATRTTEGAVLAVDLAARLERMRQLLASIEDAARDLPARFGRRLKERLAALHDAPGFDPARVAQEIALLADRLDISEELVRLRAHLDQLGVLIGSAGSVGRKLDFVIQEAAREVNTIGSKAQDAGIAALVIDCKAELEKIREQAQNVE